MPVPVQWRILTDAFSVLPFLAEVGQECLDAVGGALVPFDLVVPSPFDGVAD